MKIQFTSPSRPKRIAKELRRQLAEVGIEISLPASQDLTAQMHGYAHWRELDANIGADSSAGTDNIPERARQEQVLTARFPGLFGKTAKILEAVAYPAVEGTSLVLSDSREQAKILTCEMDRYLGVEGEGIVLVGISLRKSQVGFPDDYTVPMTFGIAVNGPGMQMQAFYANRHIDRDSELHFLLDGSCWRYPDLWGVLWRLGYPGNANIPCTRDIRAKTDAEAWEILANARAMVDRVFVREAILDLAPPPRQPRLRDLELSKLYVSASGEGFVQFEKEGDRVAAPDLFGRELADLATLLSRQEPEDTQFMLEYDMHRYVCTKLDSDGSWYGMHRMPKEFFPSWVVSSVRELARDEIITTRRYGQSP